MKVTTGKRDRCATRRWWMVMMLGPAVLALAGCGGGRLGSAATRSSGIDVSLGIYSGRPDPTWTLTEAQATTLIHDLALLPTSVGDPPVGGLGYHGFTIVIHQPNHTETWSVAYRGVIADAGTAARPLRRDPQRSIERYLLETAGPHVTADEAALVEADLAQP